MTLPTQTEFRRGLCLAHEVLFMGVYPKHLMWLETQLYSGNTKRLLCMQTTSGHWLVRESKRPELVFRLGKAGILEASDLSYQMERQPPQRWPDVTPFRSIPPSEATLQEAWAQGISFSKDYWKGTIKVYTAKPKPSTSRFLKLFACTGMVTLTLRAVLSNEILLSVLLLGVIGSFLGIILMVEDNHIQKALYKQILRQCGFKVPRHENWKIYLTTLLSAREINAGHFEEANANLNSTLTNIKAATQVLAIFAFIVPNNPYLLLGAPTVFFLLFYFAYSTEKVTLNLQGTIEILAADLPKMARPPEPAQWPLTELLLEEFPQEAALKPLLKRIEIESGRCNQHKETHRRLIEIFNQSSHPKEEATNLLDNLKRRAHDPDSTRS